MKFQCREVQLNFGTTKGCVLEIYGKKHLQLNYDDGRSSVPRSLVKISRMDIPIHYPKRLRIVGGGEHIIVEFVEGASAAKSAFDFISGILLSPETNNITSDSHPIYDCIFISGVSNTQTPAKVFGGPKKFVLAQLAPDDDHQSRIERWNVSDIKHMRKIDIGGVPTGLEIQPANSSKTRVISFPSEQMRESLLNGIKSPKPSNSSAISSLFGNLAKQPPAVATGAVATGSLALGKLRDIAKQSVAHTQSFAAQTQSAAHSAAKTMTSGVFVDNKDILPKEFMDANSDTKPHMSAADRLAVTTLGMGAVKRTFDPDIEGSQATSPNKLTKSEMMAVAGFSRSVASGRYDELGSSSKSPGVSPSSSNVQRALLDMSPSEVAAIKQMVKDGKLEEGATENNLKLIGDEEDSQEGDDLLDEADNTSELLDELENGGQLTKLPEDSLAFMISSPIFSVPFLTGSVVIFFKITIFTLIFANLINPEDTNNPLGIPPSITVAVIITQFAALFIIAFTQDDFVTSLNLLHEGYSKDMQKKFPYSNKIKWAVACLMSMVTGLLGVLAAFMLVITSGDVVDLLLNFTAVEFVALLDNAGFLLARQGFLGQTNLLVAKYIEETEFRTDPRRKKRSAAQQFLSLFFLYIVLVSVWAYYYDQQSSGRYLPGLVVAQFDDDLVSGLTAYSGAFRLNNDKWASAHNRIRYQHEFYANTFFAYCTPDEVWVFYTEGGNACENTVARSTETDTFDITESAESTWFVTADTEISRFYPMEDFTLILGCSFDIDCGGNGPSICDSEECICGDDYFGLRCDYQRSKTCTLLEVDDGFLEGSTVTYQTKFEVLLDEEGDFVFFYHKPVYISTESRRNPDIIFFSGYRWVMMVTWEAFVFDGEEITADNIAKFLTTTTPNIPSYLDGREYLQSEPVRFNTPSDAATPLDLEWYEVKERASDVVLIGPLGPILFCGVCDNRTNPCENNNICLEDNTCECLHGASGSLCQNTPVANGFCNDETYNDDAYSYDGGDCCLSTCVSTDENTCGRTQFGDISLIYTGFPNCTDPTTLCDSSSCYITKAAAVQPSIPGTSMLVTLSLSGRIMVVREPSLDTIRIYDESDSQWEQRGSAYEGTRSSNYGTKAAIATPLASVVDTRTGSVPVLLAVSSEVVEGTATVGLLQWGLLDVSPLSLGEDVDACGEAQLETCSVKSLKLFYRNSTVQMVVVLNQDVVMLLDRVAPSDETVVDGETVEEVWRTRKVFNGTEAALSDDGSTLAVVLSNRAVVRTYSIDGDLSQQDHSADLQIYGSTTEVQAVSLSQNGSHLSAFLSSSEITGGALVYHPVVSENVPTYFLEEPDYSPGDKVELASDGSAVSLLLEDRRDTSIRTYRYSTASNQWKKVGDDYLLEEFTDQSYAVSRSGETLAVSAAEEISTFLASPVCDDGEIETRLSIALSDQLDGVTWTMQSVQFLGDIVIETNTLTAKCDDCYNDLSQISRALTTDVACIPEDECVLVNFVATEGFDDGSGFVLYYNGTVEASLSDNSTDPIEILTKNGENCFIEPISECGDSESVLIVSLILDSNPEDVSWSLSSTEGHIEFGGFTSGHATHQLCVPKDACLTITLNDEGGDGFCCDSGVGTYTIYLDGELVLSELADFNFKERLYFGTCPTEIVSEIPATLFLNMDWRVNETSWSLREVGGGVIASMELGSYEYLLPRQEDTTPVILCENLRLNNFFNCSLANCTDYTNMDVLDTTVLSYLVNFAYNHTEAEIYLGDWITTCLLPAVNSTLNDVVVTNTTSNTTNVSAVEEEEEVDWLEIVSSYPVWNESDWDPPEPECTNIRQNLFICLNTTSDGCETPFVNAPTCWLGSECTNYFTCVVAANNSSDVRSQCAEFYPACLAEVSPNRIFSVEEKISLFPGSSYVLSISFQNHEEEVAILIDETPSSANETLGNETDAATNTGGRLLQQDDDLIDDTMSSSAVASVATLPVRNRQTNLTFVLSIDDLGTVLVESNGTVEKDQEFPFEVPIELADQFTSRVNPGDA